MADEYRTERIRPAAMINEYGRDHEASRRDYRAYAHPTAPASPKRSAGDLASILGLPVGLLTPEVLETAEALIAEIERLRWIEEQSARRLTHLEHQSDRHSIVPCLTRRAFMRELDGFLVGGDCVGVLAIIHLGGVERLRLVHGLAAGEGALRHGAANILAALRTTDVVGCIGGSDFATLMPAADEHFAHLKIGEIGRRINDPAFTWLGQPVRFPTIVGLHALERGEGGEQALAAADRARRGLEQNPRQGEQAGPGQPDQHRG